MTTLEPDEQDRTAPIEPRAVASTPPAQTTVPADNPPVAHEYAAPAEPREPAATEQRPALVARPASAAQQDVLFVPLAVSIGDGFKFGCGFFLAMVLALLVGFVLLTVLFVLSSLFGLTLPIAR